MKTTIEIHNLECSASGPRGRPGAPAMEYICTVTTGPALPFDQWPDNSWQRGSPGTTNGQQWYSRTTPMVRPDAPEVWLWLAERPFRGDAWSDPVLLCVIHDGGVTHED